MDEELREGLEKAGYSFGDAEDFLELNDEERQLVELRVAISRAVRSQRIKRDFSQAQAAKVMKTTQSNVSKIETASAGVSLDLMVRGLFSLGGTVGQIFAPPAKSPRRRNQNTATA